MDREARDGASSSPSGKGERDDREGVLLRSLRSSAKAGLFLFDQLGGKHGGSIRSMFDVQCWMFDVQVETLNIEH